MSYLHVKTISVLALMFLLQTSVSGQRDVIISVRDEETFSRYLYDVVFSEEQFRKFYGYMCSGAQICSARYSLGLGNVTFVDVIKVVSSTVQNKTAMPIYQCRLDLRRISLVCTLQSNTFRTERYSQAQTFRLKDNDCQSRYVTLVWFHNNEGLTVYADIPDFKLCEPAFDCALTTRRPETSLSAPVSSTTSNKEDKGDDNTGVMAGIAVAGFIVGIVVGIVEVVVVVRWKRRNNQGTKEPENQTVNSPPPASLALTDVTPASDPSTNANSVPSETAEESPREPTSIATVSVPQNSYSQIDVSNTGGHAYAALSPSPYYNSVNEITTESTYEQNTYTANSKPAYYNTPDATPNSSSAYSNTQRGPTDIISDQPETEGAYEEADVAYSPGRGDGVNLNKSAQRMAEQNDNTVYCN